jgi:uncharacterized protein (DUF433 family)
MRGYPPSRHGHDCEIYERPNIREQDFASKDFDVPISDVFERSLKGRPSIAVDYEVLGGTPHIAGTRIPVFMVLDALEYYGSLEGVLKSYPKLSADQVKDAVSFAAAVTEHPVDYEVESPSR